MRLALSAFQFTPLRKPFRYKMTFQEESCLPATLDIVQQWLLDLVIEGYKPLAWIVPFVETVALNVRDVPGCTAEDYARAFLSLFEAGMIEVFSYGDGLTESSMIDSAEELAAIVSELLAHPRVRHVRYLRKSDTSEEIALSRASRRRRTRVQYMATQKGGEQWEKLAKPDWSRFYDEWNTSNAGEVSSASLDIVLLRLGWYRELRDCAIDLRSIKLRCETDYAIVPWKRLPKVYVAEFSLELADAQWPGAGGTPDWFRDWESAANEWRTEPWELPEWPAVGKESAP